MKNPAPSKLNQVSADDVAEWFKEAWPNRNKYPGEGERDWVAGSVNIVVNSENAKSHKKPSPKDVAATREHYVKVGRHGRAFLRSSPQVREDLEKRLPPTRPEVPVRFASQHHAQLVNAYDGTMRVIDAFREAERAIDAVLDLCRPPVPWRERDTMEWIGDAAREAWGRTPTNDRVSFGVKEDDPLTCFVHLALTKIGLKTGNGRVHSLSTVSDHLRRRQGRSRSGKRRNSGRKGGAD